MSKGMPNKVPIVLNISINIRKHVEGNNCGDSVTGAFIELLVELHPEHCLLSGQWNPVQKKPKQILLLGDPALWYLRGPFLCQ